MASSSSKAILHSIFLVFSISIVVVHGRILTLNSSSSPDDQYLISDGVDQDHVDSHLSALSCDHKYGFLPCAENALGYIFQIFVYQGLLIFGGKQIEWGSKVLFEVFGVGKIGGIIFRILMALPSMLLMIVSGAFSSNDVAQSMVSVGVGIYAGITVFSLTAHWGACVFVGRRSLKEDNSTDRVDNGDSNSDCLIKLAILKEEGVRIDAETRKIGGILLLSLIPYVTVQLVDIFHSSSANRVITLIALVVSAASLISYFIYQASNTWIQERSLRYTETDWTITKEEFIEGVKKWIESISENASSDPSTVTVGLIDNLGRWPLNDESEALKNAKTRLQISISLIDHINDLLRKFNSRPERMIEGSEEELSFHTEYAKLVKKIFEDFVKDSNGITDVAELVEQVRKWLNKGMAAYDVAKSIDKLKKIVRRETVYEKRAIVLSCFQVLLGILMLTFLGGPLTTSILQLSYATVIPSFSISFVIVPLAMNTRALITALLPASQKSEDSASLTFSEIYGGVIMNNISGLTTLLFIVYFKGLTWDFSAEVLTILFVCAVIGCMAFKCSTYPLWTCILAFLLYPLSLGFYCFAHVIWGWN